MSERKLAVFDVDGTIRPGSIVDDAFWQLTERGIFQPSEETVRTLQTLKDSGSHDYIMTLVHAYVDAKKGVSIDEIRKFARSFAKDSVPLLDPEIMARIDAHKANGDLLAMISGSPGVYIRALAKELEFDAASGSRYYRSGRIYHTQRAAEDRGSMDLKPIIALKMALSLGASGICAAYGDTMGDVKVLELAENPVAVHPDYTLREVAESRSWEIIG